MVGIAIAELALLPLGNGQRKIVGTEFAAASKALYAGRAAKLPKKRANRKGILGEVRTPWRGARGLVLLCFRLGV